MPATNVTAIYPLAGAKPVTSFKGEETRQVAATAGDNPDGLSTATAAEGATKWLPFQPWITRIDPNCGLLGSLRAGTTCARFSY